MSQLETYALQWRWVGSQGLPLLAIFVVPSPLFGAAALTVAGLCALALGARHEAIDWFARLSVVAALFGFSGVGVIALSGILALALSVAMGRSLILAAPLALVTAALGVCLIPALGGSELSGVVFACLALGAPGLAIERMALRMAGKAPPEDLPLHLLGPSLIAIVLGAWARGLEGAATAIAAGMLARPLAHFFSAGPAAHRRRHRARLVAGVIVSGAVGAAALMAAARVAEPLLLGPLGALAAVGAYHVALKVHAPAAARLQRLVYVRCARSLMRAISAHVLRPRLS